MPCGVLADGPRPLTTRSFLRVSLYVIHQEHLLEEGSICLNSTIYLIALKNKLNGQQISSIYLRHHLNKMVSYRAISYHYIHNNNAQKILQSTC